MALFHHWNGPRIFDDFAPGVVWPKEYRIPSPLFSTDHLLRCIMAPRLSYRHLTGTAPSEGWWQHTNVYMTLTHDPDGTGRAIDVDEDDPHFIGLAAMNPVYTPLAISGDYVINWVPEPTMVDIQTHRKGLGLGHNPEVIIGMWAYDAIGAFTTNLYPVGRISISGPGRFLWGTEVP
jgi:hypothetical protein